MTTYSVRILRAGGWTTWTDDMTPRPPHMEDAPFQTCQHEEHGACFEWRGVHFKAIGFGEHRFTTREEEEMKNFKYVKKPVVVEAVKFDPAEATGIFVGSANPELPDWFNEGVKSGYLFHDSNGWRCRTMEGTSYTVDDGYWIIRGVKGELYPCAGDVFEQSYQQFTEEQAA